MRLALLTMTLIASLSGVSLATGETVTHVVAAENFYGDLARQIGGDRVDVVSILSNPDEDPHLFETSPSAAKAVTGADIVIYNGADYDPWMNKLLDASQGPARASIVAADIVGAKSGDNPHVWYDPKTFPAVATALAGQLARRDPAHAATFAANLAAFKASLDPILTDVAAIKAAHAGTKVTATEPVFGYMAKALGFAMLNEDFQVVVMNNGEPSPSQVAAFETSLASGQAKVLFYNSQVTDKTTQRLLDIAKNANVPVVGVTETEPKGVKLQAWFAAQLKEVHSALDRKAM